MKDTIMQGDALTVLKTLPDNLVDCVMTSPPYWGLRDYGAEGQLGLEKTFDEYIDKLCGIFDEAKRVLKPEGTCWVNLGDTYAGGGGWTGMPDDWKSISSNSKQNRFDHNKKNIGVKDKCLCNIPARFSIEMCNRGWILRNVIIWKKNNCMPSSVKDRFTVDFEYIFFFVKQKRYYFEQQFEKPVIENNKFKPGTGRPRYKDSQGTVPSGGVNTNPEGRNKRTVWTINPKPYSEAHFAVYPEELCETPINAGCPQFVCKKCGKARERIYEKQGEPRYNEEGMPEGKNRSKMKWNDSHPTKNPRWRSDMKDNGLTDCRCGVGFDGGLVLDPFMGSGTTGLVAKKLQRHYLGIELNPEYIKLAEKRIGEWLF